MPAKKQIKEVSATGCSFCILKDNEINKLNKKLVDLQAKEELKKAEKVKKELTPEELEQKKLKVEEKKKKQLEKEETFKKALQENQKLKNELLVKFGVKYD